MKFDQYHIDKEIKENISRLGYKKPTDIQFRSIPSILKGEDVLAIAQTGTGKTAAFAIPIIHMLHSSISKRKSGSVKCLIMAPTHELAIQTDQVFKTLSKHTRVKTLCVHGGVDQAPQIKQLAKGVDVVIATPGRLFDLVSQGSLVLNKIDILVLDEADHMLDLGFIKDIRDLMRHIPKKRQTLFFSATIDDKIKKLAYSLVTKAIRIQISPKDPVAKNIEHGVVFVKMDDKRYFLENVIRQYDNQKILVFARTKVRVERVKKAMQRVNIETETIHSDKLQNERDSTMKNFRSGTTMVLIATDISSRGIDIPNVEMVINYDLPENADNYVHRVGRTGRGRQKGQAVSFVSPEEKEQLLLIEDNLGKKIQRIEITKNDYKHTVEESEDQQDWKALLEEEELKNKSRSRKKRRH